ncbi:alpha/beta fold hydrolase [Nonlabens xiamenensis]|uniref:alpha/beta fold hydrolase n=1 Tax=Nonlabens xiamenensis TaxID=2341043 RepID=UPI0013DDB28C|nr:alpha/beta fold hydrolase [Nonlabens xiamenensis]
MKQWRFLSPLLASTFDILSIDLPGHGQSGEFTHEYSLEELAEELDAILKKENIHTCHLMGHSMGGYVCSAFAKANPTKVLSLHLINSMAGADTNERKIVRDRSIELIQKYQEAYISMAVSNLFTPQEQELYEDRIGNMKENALHLSTNTILQALKSMRNRESFVNSLRDVDFPVIYIAGRRDNVINAQLIEKECFNLGGRFKAINSGHMSILTSSDTIFKNLHFVE